MADKKYKLGLVGLGVMGRNLLLNMADSGFAVAGYDKDTTKVDALAEEARHHDIFGAKDVAEFTAALQRPRAVLLLVPAGKIVDAVIADLVPHLEADDLIIDGGNSYFADTDRRVAELAAKNIRFIGMGVSGGAEGARRGPSMMPGGSEAAYQTIRDLLAAVAAKVNGEPCVAYVGKGSAGHYVKMVHNGMEYGMMQLIAEAYDLLKRGLGLDNPAIGALFAEWNRGELASFLIEITSQIFTQKDERTDGYLVDQIMDASRSKGTGKWTSQDAMNLLAPIPVIDMAVTMRSISGYKTERLAAQDLMGEKDVRLTGVDTSAFVEHLRNALHFTYIVTYAQGFVQLRKASEEYHYDLDLENVARIWRGGCIIRAAMLEDFRAAFQRNPALANLLLDPTISQKVMSLLHSTRTVVKAAVDAGIPAACFLAALSYFDAYRTGRLPANLTQAQRDFFGSHTYERVDAQGVFHTEWGS